MMDDLRTLGSIDRNIILHAWLEKGESNKLGYHPSTMIVRIHAAHVYETPSDTLEHRSPPEERQWLAESHR